jgi:hypothetical protein
VRFRSFWSAGSAWGLFSLAPGRAEIGVTEGSLRLKTLRLPQAGASSVTLNGRPVAHRESKHGAGVTVTLAAETAIPAGGKLVVAG